MSAGARYDGLLTEASLLRKTADVPLAVTRLREATALAPERPEAWHLLGEVLADRGDPVGAIEALRAAVDRDPERYDAWYLLAFVSGRLGRADGIGAYRELLARWPYDFRGWHNLGCLLRDEGLADDALAAFERARDVRDDSPALWFNLGQLHDQQGRREAARSAYERALALFPGFAPAERALERLLG